MLATNDEPRVRVRARVQMSNGLSALGASLQGTRARRRRRLIYETRRIFIVSQPFDEFPNDFPVHMPRYCEIACKTRFCALWGSVEI